MIGRIAILLLALLASACASAPPVPPPSLAEQIEAVKFRLFVLVEEHRRGTDVASRPLALDPQLAAAAQRHSEEMARKNSFDAMNPDGNPALNALLSDPKFGGFVGENSAAQFFVPGRALDPDAVAKGFLTIWLDSPDHRRNMTFSRFDRTGFGVAITGNTIYAAALFATDFGLSRPQEGP
jgi:uncharacterized protein YkwD